MRWKRLSDRYLKATHWRRREGKYGVMEFLLAFPYFGRGREDGEGLTQEQQGAESVLHFPIKEVRD